MKKILILASNPRKDLSLDREIRELKDVIERSRSREDFEVEEALAVRVGDLQELLFQHEPQIVHFCGHGGGQTGLVLEGHDGGEQWVQTAALRDLFRLFSSKVRCVLLNACYSEEQASEIVNHIDYVIGMEQEIRDDAAIAFSKGFYRALGYDCSIEEAYEFGCNAIQLEITNRSTVRSATTELTRKAEVVKAVATTIIPEHMKPILKKREGAFRAEEWENNAMSFLSQEKKEAIQLELVQEVINTPPDRGLPVQPRMNSSTSASQSPQGLLGVPVARRRRIAPLIIGSMVAGLLPVIGIYSYIKLANQPKLTDPKPPVDPSKPERTLLQQAKESAKRKQWKESFDFLDKIPNDSLDSPQSEFYLEKWSDDLLKSATKYYNEGNLDDALKQAQSIPENSPNRDEVKKAIVTWNEEKKVEDDITRRLNVWDVEGSRGVLPQIKSPALLKTMEGSIAAIELTILNKAQELYNEGKVAEALEKAQRIPKGSPFHQQVQTLIATWNEEQKDKKTKPDEVITELGVPDYSWVSEQQVADADLEGKSALDLDILRNYPYAKQGLKFGRPDLQEAFKSQPWYQPTDISIADCGKKFSDQERQNLRIICTFQKERNLSLNTSLSCS
jgi:tetratricopeptide (TPR) repeat protein